ncbi:MAG: hypothetical protein GQ570_15545 [Helicobacteraceae bacterium]|nr:hypothetical protein [Helicobacteraceae bacterium]
MLAKEIIKKREKIKEIKKLRKLEKLNLRILNKRKIYKKISINIAFMIFKNFKNQVFFHQSFDDFLTDIAKNKFFYSSGVTHTLFAHIPVLTGIYLVHNEPLKKRAIFTKLL